MACTSRQAATWLVLSVLAYSLGWPSAPARAATNVAVFNFQMTSDTPDWRWLEKGLADRIATDFVQDRSLSVVARDEMQMVAQKMNWVPEMATSDPRRMKDIKRGLKITQLVTGVYSVTGEEIRITGQIVEVESRSEVARKEVTGKAADVLDLQRRLSAELLAWFSKKSVEEILGRLPVWTRSLPAAKALYEGMDLYDQGRYAEGWLRFRQASREDPDYIEALYWVGKMYYFMDRYEHARRALERFVYLDNFHPRIGDAMVEYVHTYENTSVSADDLLKLYEDLGKRYPDALVWEGPGWGSQGSIEGDEWFKYKSAQLLGQIGRHKEAAVMTRPALSEDGLARRPPSSGAPFCILNVLKHHALTAEALEPNVLVHTEWLRCQRSLLCFGTDGRAMVRHLAQPTRILGKQMQKIDKLAAFDPDQVVTSMCLVAPSGHVFQSLRFSPIAQGDDGLIEVSLRMPGTYRDFALPRTRPLSTARTEGLLFNEVPRSGMLLAKCHIRVKDARSHPIVVHGVQVEPTLTRVAAHGAIDVSGLDTSNFRVDVDGVFARWLPGLVGPLPVGEHTLRLYPSESDTPYGEWTTEVTVEAGKTTRVVGRLPWKAGSPWSSWTTTLVAAEYPGLDVRLYTKQGRPAIQADNEGIRLVWAHGGDLWACISRDGETFSPPQKLDLPVSSGWLETDPILLRDESERFVLMFLSDRDAQHRLLPYLAWSRDFVHWSAPALISDQTVASYGLIQDDRGRLIWAVNGRKGVRVSASRDGYRWEEIGKVGLTHRDGFAHDLSILQRTDGRFELFVYEARFGPSEDKQPYLLLRYLSGDAQKWSAPEELARLPSGALCRLSATHSGGRSHLLLHRYLSSQLTAEMILFSEEESNGTWRRSRTISGLLDGPNSMVLHPRWGSLIAWVTPKGHEWFPHASYGPFVMRGSSLDFVFDANQERPSSSSH